MSFHVARTITNGFGRVLLSDSDDVDTAVVYVHGFMGDARSTWEHVQYYVDRLPGEPFRNADLFFYDYRAEANFIHVSTADFRAFLDRIYPAPPAELTEIQTRELDWRLAGDPELLVLRTSRPYSRLVMVGHSLGAVILRRLVADAAIRVNENDGSLPEEQHILNSELVLMAPAHLGFRPAGYAALLHMVPFSPSILRALAVFRGFTDLQERCHVLTQLQNETVNMARHFPTAAGLRPTMLWGDSEEIVVMGRFDSDPPDSMKFAKGKDHVSVCKLNRDYTLPADILFRRKTAHGA